LVIRLGTAYLYGRYNDKDISKNTSEAKKLLKKAHDHGSETAESIYCDSLPKARQKACKF
jgi:TPR repeat protein